MHILKHEGKLLKALLYDRYGGPEVLRLREVPEPRPAAWECLVSVRAASINPSDWKLMAGQWKPFTGRRFPRPIGSDFAGVVERAGPLAGGFRPGDRVMGIVNPLVRGSLAERLAVPAWSLGRVPPALELEEAAGVPVAGSAAYLSLRHRHRNLKGLRLLLTGSGGGVGHLALQLAAKAGAEVTAMCSREKAALCLELGAARVIDYRRSEPLALRERFDLILDCASSITWAEARRLLAPHGEYIYLDTGGRIPPYFRVLASQLGPGPRIWTFLVTPSGRRLERLGELFQSRSLRMVVGGTYPLAQAAEAYRELMRGHARGKIVVKIT
jgi:NADPH:quinone reductase-like Zn-dependent oxidoreductase